MPHELTVVLDLETGEELWYFLPPQQAAATAHQQMVNDNYNFWEPDYYAPAERYGEVWTTGRFSALATRPGAAETATPSPTGATGVGYLATREGAQS